MQAGGGTAGRQEPEEVGGVGKLRLASRALTPVSPICVFQVDILPGIDYIAFATSDGCIVIQQAASAPPVGDAAGAALSLLSPTAQHQEPHCPQPNSGQFITACILDDQSGSSSRLGGHTRHVYQRLAWGGGPAYLLCAASEHHLHFFCLRHFFTQEAAAIAQAAQQAAGSLTDPVPHLHTAPSGFTSYPTTPLAPQSAQPLTPMVAGHSGLQHAAVGAAAGPPYVPIPSVCWPLLATHWLDHPLLSLDWTQNSAGLLLTDTANHVTMLSVTAHSVDSIHVLQGGLPQLTVRIAWSACSDCTQPMAAAGWAPNTPSATAHSRVNVGDGSQQHRILIWWPRPPQPPSGPSPRHAASSSHLSSSMQRKNAKTAPMASLASPTHSREPAAPGGAELVVGNEVIRHPTRVIAMQWSPPLWQPQLAHTISNPATLTHDSRRPAAKGAGQGSPGGSPALSTAGTAGSAASTVGPRSMTTGGAGPGGLKPITTTVAGGKENEEEEEAATEQLALMTVGADWAIRIWVEVQMKDLLPAHLTLSNDPLVAAAAAATLSMSQFCLALVVESPIPPPSAGPPGQLQGCMRVSWARPQALSPNSTSRAVTPAPLDAPSVPSLPQTSPAVYPPSWPPMPQPLSPTSSITTTTSRAATLLPPGMSPAAVRIASRVQWLVATVSLPSRNTGGGGGSHHGQAELQETVLVWAVDGLHAGEGSGLARAPAVGTNRGAGGPRAVLWGRESGPQVTWLQPQQLLPAKDARMHGQAYVLYPRGLPVFHLTEWWLPAAATASGAAPALAAPLAAQFGGCGGEVRTLKVAAISQDAGHTACPHTGVVLESVCHQQLWGLKAELQSLTPCALLPSVAASLHKDGCVSFWWLDPVEELPLVPSTTASPRHLQGQRLLPWHLTQLLDPCALSGMFGPVTAVAWLHPDTFAQSQLSGAAMEADAHAQEECVLTHLACAVAGTVYVYSLLLPNLAALQPGSSPTGSWGIQLVSEVLRLQLPGSFLHVTHLLQSSQTQLMALVAGAPLSSRGDEPSANSGGFGQGGFGSFSGAHTGDDDLPQHGAPVTNYGAHAVVIWQLSAQQPPVPTSQHAMSLLHLIASPPVVIPAKHALPAAPSLTSGSGADDGSHLVITCMDVPRPDACMCMVGMSAGAVQFWEVTAAGDASFSSDHTSTPVCHTCWCDIPATMPSVHQDGTDGEETAYRCLPVCVALHPTLGLAAAATTCGPAGAEDSLFVWRRTAVLASATLQAPAPEAATVLASGAQPAAGRQLVQLGDTWQLEEVVVLRDTVSCLEWLPSTHSLTALLVVGYASGVVEYHAPSREGAWQVVAEFRVGEESSGINSMAARMDGSLALAAGCHVQVLSNVLSTSPTAGLSGGLMPAASAARLPGLTSLPPSTRGTTLQLGLTPGASKAAAGQGTVMESVGQLLSKVCGPLPSHHPAALITLIRCGQPALVCRLLRGLITWLQRAAARMEHAEADTDPAMGEPTASDVATPTHIQVLPATLRGLGPTPGPSPTISWPTAYPAITPHDCAGGGGMPFSPSPFPPCPSLEQLLSPADMACGTLQVLHQLQDAPPAPTAAAVPASGSAQQGNGIVSNGSSAMTQQGSSGGLGLKSQLGGQGLSSSSSASGRAPAAGSTLHTGMLDMSSFGSFGHMQGSSDGQASAPAASTNHQSSLSSGLLDMAAFGSMTRGMHDEHAAPASAAASAAAPVKSGQGMGIAGGLSALDTGMLDMSAFGGFSMAPPDSPPAPPTPPSAPKPPPSALAGFMTDSSLATGMLDMSAFGMGYDEPPTPALAAPPAPPQPPRTPADDDSDLPLSALRLKTAAQKQPTTAPTSTATASGAGASMVQGTTPSNGTYTQSTATCGGSQLEGDLVLFPRVLPTSTHSSIAAVAGAASIQDSFAATAGGGGAVDGGAGGSGAGQKQDTLPACLLTQAEAAALQLLLGVDLQQCIDQRPGAKACDSAQQEGGSGTSLLPSYLQEEDGSAAAAARAAQLRAVLQLSSQEATRLVVLARSLTSTSLADLQQACSTEDGLGAVLGAAPLQPSSSLLRSGARLLTSPKGPLPTVFSGVFTNNTFAASDAAVDGMAGGSNAADVMQGLDAPAQSFLLAVRLAAAAEVLEPAARPAAVDDDTSTGKLAAVLGHARSGSGVPSSMMGPSSSNMKLTRHDTSYQLDGAGSTQGSSTSPREPRSLQARMRNASTTSTKHGGLSKPSASPMLSFSSLSGLAAGSRSFTALWGLGAAEGSGARAQHAQHAWWQRVGCFRDLSMRSVLLAAASGSQAALLAAALPHVPWDKRSDELAAPDTGRNAFSSSSVRAGRPELSWPLMRKLGAGLWLLDQPALTAKVEELARAQFARRKDPYECALLYLALGKKPVLLNLFKQASNRKLIDFLSRDFKQEAARVAAAKNAYALLGQHRYELAAAFFLLGGSLREAVGVLAHERGDPQLALVVARLSEGGPGGPEGHRIITQDLMPAAKASSDPAAVACCLWADGRAAAAVQLLAMSHGPQPAPGNPVFSAPTAGLAEGSAAGVQQPNEQELGPAAAASQDPGLLHFVLAHGLKQLAGRPVPRSLAQGVCMLALECARVLEQQGTPALALQALLQALMLLQPKGATSSNSPANSPRQSRSPVTPTGMDVLQHMFSRLVSASLLHSCLAELPAVGQPPGLASIQASSVHPRAFSAAAAGGGGRHDNDGTLIREVWPSLVGQVKWVETLGGQLVDPSMQLAAVPDALLACIKHTICSLQPGVAYCLPPPQTARVCTNPQALLVSPLASTVSPAVSAVPLAHGGPSTAPMLGSSGASAFSHQQHQQATAPLVLGAVPNVQAPVGHPAHAIASMPSLSAPVAAYGSRGGGGNLSRTASNTSNISGGLLSHGSVSGLRHTYSGSSIGYGSEASSYARPGGSVFVEPLEVMSVEGDKCATVICCSARGASAMGRSKADTRPVVAALGKAGLLSGEVDLPSSCQAAALGPVPGDEPGGSGWARQGSLFMGLLGQVLEHVRWTPDPWAAVTSAHASSPNTPTRAHGDPQHVPALRGGSGMFTTGIGSPIHLTASSSTTHTNAMAAHPSREHFVSGSSGDHVFLWRFGDPSSKQVYVPLVDPAKAAAAQASSAPVGGHHPRSGHAAAALGLAPDPACTSHAALAIDSSAPGRKQLLLQVLASPHWDGAARLRYAPGGTRFVGVGVGGLVAVWRQDLAPSAAGLGYADWLHHCVPKRGCDVLPVDDAGLQFIVCGKGDRGGVISWWDTQAPPNAQCVAEIRGRRATPTCMQLMSTVGAGTLLVVGDDGGELCAYDLRMMRTQHQQQQQQQLLPVWSLPRVHPHGAACLSLAAWGADQDPHGLVLNRPLPATPHGHLPQVAYASSPHLSTAGIATAGLHSAGPSGQFAGSMGSEVPAAQAAIARGGTSQSQLSLTGAGQQANLPPGGGSAGTVALRSLVACGGKEGSIALVDATNGTLVQLMHRAHWQVKRNPLSLLTGDRTSGHGAGGRPPHNAVGVPVTGLESCEGGLLSCGADGVVRYHCLSAVAGLRL